MVRKQFNVHGVLPTPSMLSPNMKKGCGRSAERTTPVAGIMGTSRPFQG
ncbi:hypothetical protein ARMA_1998 [Ardenticatena maritima]|uniref:Uncharacterized protein n=1 Tax=Ardenticatena maritima TaxID=872965 RepID=A0A0M9UD35_9CHLR|nr:hypothetical protein ARMA_1998 [Ardenticatena maritima]